MSYLQSSVQPVTLQVGSGPLQYVTIKLMQLDVKLKIITFKSKWQSQSNMPIEFVCYGAMRTQSTDWNSFSMKPSNICANGPVFVISSWHCVGAIHAKNQITRHYECSNGKRASKIVNQAKVVFAKYLCNALSLCGGEYTAESVISLLAFCRKILSFLRKMFFGNTPWFSKGTTFIFPASCTLNT